MCLFFQTPLQFDVHIGTKLCWFVYAFVSLMRLLCMYHCIVLKALIRSTCWFNSIQDSGPILDVFLVLHKTRNIASCLGDGRLNLLFQIW